MTKKYANKAYSKLEKKKNCLNVHKSCSFFPGNNNYLYYFKFILTDFNAADHQEHKISVMAIDNQFEDDINHRE